LNEQCNRSRSGEKLGLRGGNNGCVGLEVGGCSREPGWIKEKEEGRKMWLN